MANIKSASMSFQSSILFVVLFFVLNFSTTFSQSVDTIQIKVPDLTLEGTLLIPDSEEIGPLALLISGSGPTDRDGNQKALKNNSLKYLAEGLLDEGIASFRYDKRSCYPEYIRNIKEEDVSFDDFVNDTKAWIDHFKNDQRFSEIIIIGHSQGSLIGILASQNESRITKMISLCGPGKSIGSSLIRQLTDNGLKEIEKVTKLIESLEAGNTSEDYPPYLANLFRPSLQPFLISWMKYHPGEEVKKLSQDLLVIHGTTDSQISLDESEALALAKEGSQMIILENMNHVLKEVEDNFFKNRQAYTNPDLAIHPELIKTISSFIKE